MPLPSRQAFTAICDHPEDTALETDADRDDDPGVVFEAGDIIILAKTITRTSARPGTEEGSEPIGFNNYSKTGVTPEVSYIPDMFEYLTGGPMLCEVVSLMRGGDTGQDKQLRSQRAAALQARSVEECQSLT